VLVAATAAAAHARQQHDAWIATCREAQAEVTRREQAWRDLERARLASNAVTVEDVTAAIAAYHEAKKRAEVILPPLGPDLELAEMAAYREWQQALIDDKRLRRNRLGDERRALLRRWPALQESLDDWLQAMTANIDDQQALDLDLGIDAGDARDLLARLVGTAVEDALPELHRRRFPALRDLEQADTALLPISAEALAGRQQSDYRWIRYQGPRVDSGTWQRFRGTRLDAGQTQGRLERDTFLDGKAIQVSPDEERALRERYGDGNVIRVTQPLGR
jgi:hypothetical protein